MALVCFDPGHGGTDPGAVGPNGLTESGVVLDVAARAARLWARHGRSVLTRTSDTFVDLVERCRIANRAGADAFVSVHCNGFVSPSPKGIETFHAPASSVGKSLAGFVQSSVISTCSGHINRGVKSASFFVLRNTAMPAVLLECEFITNPSSEIWLSLEESRSRLARAVVGALVQHFGQVALSCAA